MDDLERLLADTLDERAPRADTLVRVDTAPRAEPAIGRPVRRRSTALATGLAVAATVLAVIGGTLVVSGPSDDDTSPSAPSTPSAPPTASGTAGAEGVRDGEPLFDVIGVSVDMEPPDTIGALMGAYPGATPVLARITDIQRRDGVVMTLDVLASPGADPDGAAGESVEVSLPMLDGRLPDAATLAAAVLPEPPLVVVLGEPGDDGLPEVALTTGILEVGDGAITAPTSGYEVLERTDPGIATTADLYEAFATWTTRDARGLD